VSHDPSVIILICCFEEFDFEIISYYNNIVDSCAAQYYCGRRDTSLTNKKFKRTAFILNRQ